MSASSSSTPEERLASLGYVLPPAAAPIAAYVPVLRVGSWLWVSGQLPFDAEGALRCGRLTSPADLERGCEAARLCGLNVLAQLDRALGSLSAVGRAVRLGGFVAADAGFDAHSAVIDAASALMVSVFGERGRHVRVAMGVSSLPRGACVELEALFSTE